MLAVILLVLLRVMPFELSIGVMRIVVRLYAVLSRRARLELERAGTHLGRGRFRKEAYLDHAALNLALMARMGTRFSRNLAEKAVIEGEEHVKILKDEENAGVVVTFHYGPWELLAEAFSSRGYRVGALVGRQRSDIFGSYLAALRRRTGLVTAHDLGQAKGILNRGVFLATFFDKTRRAKGLSFGLPYSDYEASVLGERISRKTRMPLLPVACRFTEKKLHIKVGTADADLHKFFAPLFDEEPFHWLVWGD